MKYLPKIIAGSVAIIFSIVQLGDNKNALKPQIANNDAPKQALKINMQMPQLPEAIVQNGQCVSKTYKSNITAQDNKELTRAFKNLNGDQTTMNVSFNSTPEGRVMQLCPALAPR